MHVGIVGAGVSGLYTGLLLQREGHKVTLFEAANRVGGRLYTYRFKPHGDSEETYFEAGAMRIPRSALHAQVFDLVRYLNTYGPVENKIELIPYILEHDNNASFFRGKKGKVQDEQWAADAGLPEPYQGRTAQELLGTIVVPWLEKLRKDFDTGFKELLEYDEYSFRAYLRLVAEWPHEVVEFVELFCSQTNQYELSFTEIIMQNLDFDTTEWATVQGGMSRIAECAAAIIGADNIHLESRVHHIAYTVDGRVKISARSPNADPISTGVFDAVVLATPPLALHSIVDRPTWSFMKEQSIRGTHFEPLYKMGLHFRTRFWERSATTPMLGGQSTTDLRFRWIVYPSNDIGSDGSGVLLLYSWMTDAMKWAGLSQQERIRLCLHDLSKFYADEPDIDVHEQYIEAFDVLWMNEFCGGDAMFLPGQFSRFHQIAKQPEKNIYFTGEHLSKHHTWIAGAVDSALNTTTEILARCASQKSDMDTGVEKVLPPLGHEILDSGDESSTPGTPYSPRTPGTPETAVTDKSQVKTCIIPKHLDVQYVEVLEL